MGQRSKIVQLSGIGYFETLDQSGRHLLRRYLWTYSPDRSSRDPHAVAINAGTDIVGHVPENICGVLWRFLSLPNASIRAEVLGPRVNRGAGHGLEVPVRFIFQGHRKAVEWVRKKLNEEEAKIEAKFKKCLKNAV